MSFFRYPGGKTKLLPQILTALQKQNDRHFINEYREPFFGGGSIGLEVMPRHDITFGWINDKDTGIAALWKSVIKYPTELKKKIATFRPSVEAFHDFKDVLTNTPKLSTCNPKMVIELGFKKLAIHQLSYSGLGTKSGGPLGGEHQNDSTVYHIGCRWSPDKIQKKIDAILDKIRTPIEVTDLDFESLIVPEARGKVLMYLDPPYYKKGNELYECGFVEEDHKRLADMLRYTSHAWVLSYDDCPEIRNLYEGWSEITSIDVNYSINATKVKIESEDGKHKRVPTKKSELIISKMV